MNHRWLWWSYVFLLIVLVFPVAHGINLKKIINMWYVLVSVEFRLFGTWWQWNFSYPVFAQSMLTKWLQMIRKLNSMTI
jgi:hypothetical protein